MGLGGEGCSAVVTAGTGPDSLSWPHLYSSSILDLPSHGPELTPLSPKLPASSIQSGNARCTGFSGEGE